MKKLEKREVMVTYCDRCKKELKGNYSSVNYDGKEKMDFCSTYTSKINKTCLDYHNEEMTDKNETLGL